MTFLDLINEIKACMKDKHYLAALSLALTIPDICGQIEFPELVGNKTAVKRYKEWYKKYIGKNESMLNEHYDCEKYSWIDEDIVYSIRCNLFHEGFAKVDSNKVNREINKADIFCLEFHESSTFRSIHTDIIEENGTFKTRKRESINIPYLCNLLVKAGESYYAINGSKFNIDCSVDEYYSSNILYIYQKNNHI